METSVYRRLAAFGAELDHMAATEAPFAFASSIDRVCLGENGNAELDPLLAFACSLRRSKQEMEQFVQAYDVFIDVYTGERFQEKLLQSWNTRVPIYSGRDIAIDIAFQFQPSLLPLQDGVSIRYVLQGELLESIFAYERSDILSNEGKSSGIIPVRLQHKETSTTAKHGISYCGGETLHAVASLPLSFVAVTVDLRDIRISAHAACKALLDPHFELTLPKGPECLFRASRILAMYHAEQHPERIAAISSDLNSYCPAEALFLVAAYARQTGAIEEALTIATEISALRSQKAEVEQCLRTYAARHGDIRWLLTREERHGCIF